MLILLALPAAAQQQGNTTCTPTTKCRKEIIEATEGVAELRGKVADLEQAKTDLEKANADLRTDLEKANADLRADLEKANADLRTDLEKADADLKADIDALTQDLEQWFGGVNTTTSLVQGADEEYKNCRRGRREYRRSLNNPLHKVWSWLTDTSCGRWSGPPPRPR